MQPYLNQMLSSYQYAPSFPAHYDVFSCRQNKNIYEFKTRCSSPEGYDASGNYTWAQSVGNTSNDMGYSIVLDASENIYTTGSFGGTSDFDPGSGVFNLTSIGGKDAFVQKMSQAIIGINENDFSNNINVYPNPSTGAFTVKFDGLLNGVWSIAVYDLMGQLISTQKADSNSEYIIFQINIKGLYFVCLQNGSNRVTQKVIVE